MDWRIVTIGQADDASLAPLLRSTKAVRHAAHRGFMNGAVAMPVV